MEDHGSTHIVKRRLKQGVNLEIKNNIMCILTKINDRRKPLRMWK
jgi:hypothetical protein